VAVRRVVSDEDVVHAGHRGRLLRDGVAALARDQHGDLREEQEEQEEPEEPEERECAERERERGWRSLTSEDGNKWTPLPTGDPGVKATYKGFTSPAPTHAPSTDPST
jgi:hypothetical protein